ncbi:Penicillin-binding protein 1C [bioreactor metagenome]|uniref:peptidoglycan glycosyltransferase n=1 Tax=bioreactor metagenome TaxID=1076179 RepID=A0A644U3J5_9ZZZZ|nr:penicillin-binding protein 1C [Lentimicrobium sp.]MEA5109762.1 penicillin-binding protein 1C [Lentimicrobium sp.]
MKIRFISFISHKWLRLILLWPALVFLLSFFVFLLIDRIFPFRVPEVSWSKVVYASDSTLLHAFLSKDDKWRIPVRLDEITPGLEKAFIFKEDRLFYYHPGVNPFSVCRAVFNNITKGRRTSGASTITMQVVRLLDPAPRTYKAKIREMFRSLQLEWHLDKKEILQLYINLLPYGGNIEGVKAASLYYFAEEPRELSLAQIAMLTVIPNDPNALRPDENADLLRLKRDFWLKKMGRKALFSPAVIADALNEPFSFQRYPIVRKAPHLSYRLKKINAVSEIYTTINPSIQHRVETLSAAYVRRLRSFQIGNLAVVVVNNRTTEVEAYLGSAGFDEDAWQGQVDGVQALRSPGSALKPALYAMAFDQGLITPKMVVTDVPQNFSGYRPENYDETYRGKVSIEQALSLSLNVPAVELLNTYGVDRFNNKLAKSGFRWIASNKVKLGLSTILGGCGTTLEELTTLYAAFANEGIVQKLKYLKNENSEVADTLCSPGAAFVITDILTRLQRPDLPNHYQMAANLPKIAWKTGTSYGRRDGWAVGYNSNYTIGVWTGNFQGNGVPELNGAEFAVPLLFNIFNAIQSLQNDDWFAPTPDLDYRLVCSESGLPPDTFCVNRVIDYFLPGISPSMRCNHLEKHFVNQNQTISYCRNCIPEKGYREVMYPFLPPELIAWYSEMQIPFKAVPEHNPECPSVKATGAPTITSLTDGAEYLIFNNRKQQLMLACNTENGVTKVYWYLNDKFYKTASPNEKVFFFPDAGNYKISCTDDRGRNSDMWVRVTFI